MTALRDSDYEASWNLVTPDIQTEIGGYEQLGGFGLPSAISVIFRFLPRMLRMIRQPLMEKPH